MGSIKVWAWYMAMVVQFTYAGSKILIKIALNKGLSQLVFMVYRHLIAMLLLGPLAYFLERKQRPSLSLPTMIKIFFLSSLGTIMHLNYISNSFRLEKLKLESANGRDKVCGTLICIGGALIFTFWKGGYLFKGFIRSPLINSHDESRGSTHGSMYHKENWIKGSLLILTGNTAWRPIFAAMFSLLQLIIVGIFSAIVFAEGLHLGGLIGAILIVMGLYLVLWEKSSDNPLQRKVENNDKNSLDPKTLEISVANQPSSINTNSSEKL
ncbi:hypothetical protein NE237_002902 [Protea cynaroides]|uniref:WAT1-related protein n=1 Tax=Protea cynaroides TaxID=273540 RepID=A0A9Q0KFU9_9MAGN|nr:hypothetical protein NE237_002902 [Protea cynaroides]